MWKVTPGTTSYRGFRVRILDATTGAPYTSATSATTGASFGYTRPGGTRTSISLSDLAAVDSAYSSGGIKHIGSGWYRLDVPDAAIAAGVDGVLIDGAFTSYVVVCPLILLETTQTGDSFARIGAPAGASVSADIAAIEAQTDDIGAAGAGLTAVPWNAAWDAEVQSEAADALAATDAIPAAAVSAAAAAKIADVILRRTAANIEASASGDTLSVESLYGLIMASFEAALSGTTLTVRKSDGSTLGTKTVGVDATADPIVSIT